MTKAALVALAGLAGLCVCLVSGRQLASIQGSTLGSHPQPAAQQPRIIKGEPVGNLPAAEAQVFLDTVVALFNLPIMAPGCGGALIEASTVLTAAHCVDFLSPAEAKKLRLWYNGSSNVRASNIFIHPGWVPDSDIVAGVPRYDIAAIKLETPIVGANLAALVRKDATLEASGLDLQVAGFGETETAFISKLLMHTRVKYLTPEDCPRRGATDAICAGITADACSGDSGGPLFYPPQNGNPAILVGLVSYGPDCDETLASGSTPVGFYTDLRKHYDAIMAWVEGHQYDWTPPVSPPISYNGSGAGAPASL